MKDSWLNTILGMGIGPLIYGYAKKNREQQWARAREEAKDQALRIAYGRIARGRATAARDRSRAEVTVMHKAQKQVQEFHRAIGQPTSPAEPQLRNAELRARLIAEEAAETIYALVGGEKALEILLEYAHPHPHHKEYQQVGGKEPDFVEVIDGLCDTVVVCLGTAEEIGIDLEPFFDEVMRSNMTKADAPVREDGKRMKGLNFSPPNIAGILRVVSDVQKICDDIKAHVVDEEKKS